MFGMMYISVQSCCNNETVLVNHHTSSLLCGKILTTPTDTRLEAKNAKGGNLNHNCFQQYVFPKLGKPR